MTLRVPFLELSRQWESVGSEVIVSVYEPVLPAVRPVSKSGSFVWLPLLLTTIQ